MSDAITVEKFIDALEPIKHDREENTLLLSIPLDVWEKYMSGTTNGTNEGEHGMSEETKTFRVTVPYQETVLGRAFYIVEATSKEKALELVRADEVYVHDTVIDSYALDDFQEDFDKADVEEC